MADAAEILSGISSHVWVMIFGVLIGWATIHLRYAVVAILLKWLALVLFAYVITAFLVGPHWSTVAHDTLMPTMPRGGGVWATVVAILGTTISPYLFFWQASQEVEEEKAMVDTHSLREGTQQRVKLRVENLTSGSEHFSLMSPCSSLFSPLHSRCIKPV